ncbi:MAG TPA: FecR domain-containing protein [Flavisolibacter sp.]
MKGAEMSNMNEQIHNLLGKYFSGEATVEEKEAVQRWAGEHPDNRAEFSLLSELWNGPATPLITFNTDRAWAAVDAKIRAQEGNRSRQAPVIRMSRYAIGIAAALVLVLGTWWIFGQQPDMQTLVASADAQQVRLQDGSMVYLKKGSSISYPETFGDTRKVSLEGEAFFDVVKDPARAFIISAEEAEVRVLGTSFSVNTAGDQVELIVKTGRVLFSAAGDEESGVTVVAGERAIYSNDIVSKQANADPNFNAWQSRTLEFSDASLQEVVSALSQFYHTTIDLDNDPQVRQTRVTVTFRNQTVAAAMEDLSLITGLAIEKTGPDHYTIRTKKD